MYFKISGWGCLHQLHEKWAKTPLICPCTKGQINSDILYHLEVKIVGKSCLYIWHFDISWVGLVLTHVYISYSPGCKMGNIEFIWKIYWNLIEFCPKTCFCSELYFFELSDLKSDMSNGFALNTWLIWVFHAWKFQENLLFPFNFDFILNPIKVGGSDQR